MFWLLLFVIVTCKSVQVFLYPDSSLFPECWALKMGLEG